MLEPPYRKLLYNSANDVLHISGMYRIKHFTSALAFGYNRLPP